MSTTVDESDEGASHGIGALSCAPHDMLTHLGDKWTILVVLLLAQTPGNRLRFSGIKRGVEGISQRMLTLTLRMLERNGLVVRHYFAEVPPRVEYELSVMGKGMLPPLEFFAKWIGENWQAMERARTEYDARSVT
ncbi:MAG: helix-turn-helix domain-containing protein [Azospirillaceae bacterium]|nr:helix-turn-helix domain-containing protein [Azospirillaceae bacterium]